MIGFLIKTILSLCLYKLKEVFFEGGSNLNIYEALALVAIFKMQATFDIGPEIVLDSQTASELTGEGTPKWEGENIGSGKRDLL